LPYNLACELAQTTHLIGYTIEAHATEFSEIPLDKARVETVERSG